MQKSLIFGKCFALLSFHQNRATGNQLLALEAALPDTKIEMYGIALCLTSLAFSIFFTFFYSTHIHPHSCSSL